ncbi:FUSC family protein [Halomonas sp. WWR20]
MPPIAQAYLTPSSSAVKFATKGTLAMFLALYFALWADLERPYWALISAAFLQIRPMSGMVVEKGICQMAGTFVGAVAGLIIMALFSQARVPALYSLTLWLMLCVYWATMTRNNLSYGCIMAAVTALLIVVLAGSNPTSAFDVAVARLSELGLGALCATFVSALLWPTHVQQHLATQADNVVNLAFVHAAQQLEGSHDDTALQNSLAASLGPLMMLETDSQAARYEGPAGPGRVRAAHTLTRHTLAMFASLAALNQMLRDSRNRLGSDLTLFAAEIAEGLRRAEQARGVPEAREALQHLRHQAHQREIGQLSGLQQRMVLGLREVLGQATILFDAREAIARPGSRRLRSPSLSWHRDHMVASINAVRAGLVFLATALFWLATNWNNGPVAMMLATLFSAFFASRDNPAGVSLVFFKGMLAAIPSAFIFGHVLLSQASGFPMLAMLFGTPLFLGLLGAGHPAMMGYSLAFTIFNILLTMPGNGMDFGIDSFLNRAVAVIVGLTMVTLGFRLIPGPGPRLLRHRLVKAIVRDLHRLTRRRRFHQADAWFSGRMADRMLQLSRHDEVLPEDQRYLFSLGLTGLDVGRACLRLRQRLDDADAPEVRSALQRTLTTLARAYADSARGHPPQGVEDASRALIAVVARHESLPMERRILLEGLLERVHLTLQRQARLMTQATSARPHQPTAAQPE